MKPRKLSDRPEHDPVVDDLAQVATAVAEDLRTEVIPEADDMPPVPEDHGYVTAPVQKEQVFADATPVARNWIVNLESQCMPRDINIDASAGCKTPEEVRALLHQRLDVWIKAIKPTR